MFFKVIKRINIFIAVVLFVTGLFICSAYIVKQVQSYKQCIECSDKQKYQYSQIELISSLHIICYVRTLDRHNGFIVAIFTVFIAIGTGYLGWATWRLVNDSNNTAQRQLRAYVHAFLNANLSLSSEIPKVEIMVENTGQTPAYELRVNATIKALQFPLTEALPPISPHPDGIDSKIVLHPRAQIPSDIFFDGEWTKEAFNLINRESAPIRLYLFGEIIYKDIYGIERETLFLLVSIRNKFTLQHELMYCPDGNKAT